MGLDPILQSNLKNDFLSLHFLVLLFHIFSSFKSFQGLGGPTHSIFIFKDEVIIEMRISTVPGEVIMEMRISTVPGDK